MRQNEPDCVEILTQSRVFWRRSTQLGIFWRRAVCANARSSACLRNGAGSQVEPAPQHVLMSSDLLVLLAGEGGVERGVIEDVLDGLAVYEGQRQELVDGGNERDRRRP